MSRVAVLLLVLSATLAGLGYLPAAAQPSDGVVNGTVTNGTQGTADNNTAFLEVTLITYQDGTIFNWVSAPSGPDGSFHFEGLERGSEYSHQCSVEYLGVHYASEMLSFAESETEKSASVIVYENTHDDEGIAVLNTHMAIYTDENPFRLVEQYTFFNEGDRTYVGLDDGGANQGTTLLFSLPSGAVDLQLQLGLLPGHTVTTEGGFADTTPVMPGSRVVSFSYYLPSESATMEFSKTVNYETYSQSVVVLGGEIGVNSDQLPQQDILVIPDSEGNEREWTLISGSNLAPGTELKVTLSGLSGSSNTVLWVVGALVVAALAFILIYLLMRRRLRRVAVAVPNGGNDFEGKREALLRQIAELDDDFEEGSISKEAYETRRSEKKAELVRLIKKAKPSAGAAKRRN